VVVFAALALVWTFPLVRHLSTHVPGQAAGDNVSFLWNFWWMRRALASGLGFFYTPYLFVPTGTDLTLHTHTALPAFVGATMLGALPVVAALNLTIVTALILNCFCAYVLAWRITRDYGAAMLGGIVFGGSPYIAAHMNGHFNLTSAWTIPLFAVTVSEAIRGSTKWAVLAGLLLGATAYVDYYYVVYECVLALCIGGLASWEWSVAWRGPTERTRRLAKLVSGLILVDIAVLALITTTGGFNAQIGPIRISAHDLFNPLQAFWILVALLLWLQIRPRVDARRREAQAPTGMARAILIMAAVFLAAAAPLAWNGIGLFLRGDYVTQQYFWRSASKGIDIGTLVLGNPFQGLWGRAVQRVYQALGIDAIESTGWLGLAPVVFAAWALRRHLRKSNCEPDPMGDGATSRMVRQWSVIGAVFFVWALGPHLMVFGRNTGMILPQAVLRYVPVMNNARIPGRAMVVVYLALGILMAVAAAEWRLKSRGGQVALVAMAFVVVADYVPAPFPVVAMDRPAIYEMLRNRVEQGALCELPLGFRDGFGERGTFDDRVLFYQTIHQRPLAGGFVARLPRVVATAYEDDPLLAALLRLSDRRGQRNSPRPLPSAQVAADRLREDRITFVVLNRGAASPRLVEYVERVLPLTLIANEGERSLYLVLR